MFPKDKRIGIPAALISARLRHILREQRRNQPPRRNRRIGFIKMPHNFGFGFPFAPKGNVFKAFWLGTLRDNRLTRRNDKISLMSASIPRLDASYVGAIFRNWMGKLNHLKFRFLKHRYSLIEVMKIIPKHKNLRHGDSSPGEQKSLENFLVNQSRTAQTSSPPSQKSCQFSAFCTKAKQPPLFSRQPTTSKLPILQIIVSKCN